MAEMTMPAPVLETVEEGMPLEDYLALGSDVRLEIINGVRTEKMPGFFGHDSTGITLETSINDITRPQNLGRAMREVTFILPGRMSQNWVRGSRIPDVSYYQQGRLDEYKAQTPDWRDQPFALVPDLVVEVLSKNDDNTDVANKIAAYLQDGVRAVWLVDPFQRKVFIYRPAGNFITTLNETDTLDGGEIIPGFALPVAALFE